MNMGIILRIRAVWLLITLFVLQINCVVQTPQGDEKWLMQMSNVRHGRNLIWTQTDDESSSGISNIVAIGGDPDEWVPNKTATTRFIKSPNNKWHFSGLAFNYDKQTLYWSDTGNKKIQGLLLNGSNTPFTVFDGISSGVESLALDWLTGNLYWIDSLYNWIIMAPAVQDTGMFRIIVKSDLDQPMGLAVHPLRGLLFWSDWGAVPKIERSDLTGENRKVLVDSRIVTPMGLVINLEESRLYWVDRNQGTIESIDIFGRNRRILFTVEESSFVAIAMYHDHLFVTDSQDKLLYAFNQKTGKHEVNFSTGPSTPSSIIMYDSMAQKQPSHRMRCDRSGCDQLCVSTYGGHPKCLCVTGYELQADGKTCVDDGKYPLPMFIYSIGSALCRFPGNLPDMNLDGVTLETQCFLTNRSVVAIAANVRESMLYFAENGTKTISRVRLSHGESPEIVIGGTGIVEGLAVDWLAANLYWTDSEVRKIFLSKSDGRFQQVLHGDGLDHPRGLAIDAINRYLYWTDVGQPPRIERSYLDGTDRDTFVYTNLGSPNHITVDYLTSRIIWADSDGGVIESVTFRGSDRRVTREQHNAAFFGITTFQDFVIWTETGSTNGIYAGYKDSGEKIRGIVHPNVGTANDVITFGHSVQPLSNAPCDTFHTCQQLCLPGRDPRRESCACAMGFTRGVDQRSCITEPWYDNFLLFADTFQKQIYQMNIHTGDFKAISLSGHDNPISIDFDPEDRKIYWSDVSSKVLKRAFMNGSEEEIVKLLSSEAVPDGIALDHISRLLYYTDVGNRIIAALTLKDKYHVTLIDKGLNKPRAIALDPVRGYMFWTDWSNRSRIERASMDGSQRRYLVDTGDGGWPNGLTVNSQDKRVYWCNARTNTIQSVDLEGNDRKLLYRDSRSHFFGLTHIDNALFYTDWTKKTIMKLERFGEHYSSTAIGQSVFARVNDIHAYKYGSDSMGVNLNGCSVRNGGCSHICLPTPKGRTCACPDGINMIPGSQTCDTPELEIGSGMQADDYDIGPTLTLLTTPSEIEAAPKNDVGLTDKTHSTYRVTPPPRESLPNFVSTLRKSSPSLYASKTRSAVPSIPTTQSTTTSSVEATSTTTQTVISILIPQRSTPLPWWHAFLAPDIPSETRSTAKITPSVVPPTLPVVMNNKTDIEVTNKPSDKDMNSGINMTLSEKVSINSSRGHMDSTIGPPSPRFATDPDKQKPHFPLFNPYSSPPTPVEVPPRSEAGEHNIKTNASGIVIIDDHVTYIGLSGLLIGGFVVMVAIITLAVVLYKRLDPHRRKRKPSQLDSIQAVSSHVPEFPTYDLQLQDSSTSHTSAERLASLGDSYFSGEDTRGLENPSFIRRDSGNTIYEEIPGYSDQESPTFTTFAKAASEIDSQFGYLTDEYSYTDMSPSDGTYMNNINSAHSNPDSGSVYTTTAHVHAHAHSTAMDQGYLVMHSNAPSHEESSFMNGISFQLKNKHKSESPPCPPVPEKKKCLNEVVYATISKPKRNGTMVGQIAARLEKHHAFRNFDSH